MPILWTAHMHREPIYYNYIASLSKSCQIDLLHRREYAMVVRDENKAEFQRREQERTGSTKVGHIHRKCLAVKTLVLLSEYLLLAVVIGRVACDWLQQYPVQSS